MVHNKITLRSFHFNLRLRGPTSDQLVGVLFENGPSDKTTGKDAKIFSYVFLSGFACC